MSATLFHEAEIVTCICGHTAIDHHGVDPQAKSGGCFGTGSGFAWSSHPKCSCIRTCDGVLRA